MNIKGLSRLFVLILMSLPALQVSATPQFNGGTLIADKRISAFDSPLVLTETVVIPQGVTLVIDPGVEIQVIHDDWAFSLMGNLKIGSNNGEVVARGNSHKFIAVSPVASEANLEIIGLSAYGVGEISVLAGTSVTLRDSRFIGPHFVFTEWSGASIELKRNAFFSTPSSVSTAVNGRCNSYGIAVNHSLGSVEVVQNSFQGGDFAETPSCSAWISHVAPQQLASNFRFDGNIFDTGKTPIAHFRTSGDLGKIFINNLADVRDLINPSEAMLPETTKVAFSLLERPPSMAATFWNPIEEGATQEDFSQRIFYGAGHTRSFTRLNSAQLSALSELLTRSSFVVEKAHCVGIRTASMTYNQSLEIRKHAKALCEELVALNPNISHWYGSKLSSATSLAGHVLVVLKRD